MTLLIAENFRVRYPWHFEEVQAIMKLKAAAPF
jgi:hypothetical protein